MLFLLIMTVKFDFKPSHALIRDNGCQFGGLMAVLAFLMRLMTILALFRLAIVLFSRFPVEGHLRVERLMLTPIMPLILLIAATVLVIAIPAKNHETLILLTIVLYSGLLLMLLSHHVLLRVGCFIPGLATDHLLDDGEAHL